MPCGEGIRECAASGVVWQLRLLAGCLDGWARLAAVLSRHRRSFYRESRSGIRSEIVLPVARGLPRHGNIAAFVILESLR